MSITNAGLTLILCALLATSCKDASTGETTSTTDSIVAAKTSTAIRDVRGYAQYVTCKIDGQPYDAYYADGHTTGITNSLNMPSRLVFSTSADQEEVNGKTKISELEIQLFGLSKKPTGALTSNGEFYIAGHTDFPQGSELKYVRFASKAGQTMQITSNKDGVIEGTFSVDVADESDASHILKITDGAFKLATGGDTKVKVNANGDANMDSLLNSIK
jgi:hypothetical protein